MTEHSRGNRVPRGEWAWVKTAILALLALGVWSLIGAFLSTILLAFWVV